MNFEEMSDFEINQLVAMIVTGGDVIERHDMAEAPTDDGVQVIYKAGIHGEFVDYCNNQSDMMPIVFENEISLTPTGLNGVWVAMHKPKIDKDNKIHANILEYSENPLRAAAICFLEMMEVKNVDR